MHLSRVVVCNFRNLKDFSAVLGPGLNVLVGRNNVGKTNLMDAVCVALGPGATNRYIRLEEEDWHREPGGTRSGEPIRVSLEFAGLSTDERAQFIEILDDTGGDPDTWTASVHFAATWSSERSRASTRRWGGRFEAIDSALPESLLQDFVAALLPALRDAQNALVAGRGSRLGRFLRELVQDADKRQEIVGILQQANLTLTGHDAIQDARVRIGGGLTDAVGLGLEQTVGIQAAEPEFERIAEGLRLVLQDDVDDGARMVEELARSGLGVNNLLYVSTVIAELQAVRESRGASFPLLLIEEPEAHLHPQWLARLTAYLRQAASGGGEPRRSPVQTLVTTHSPIVANGVDPNEIVVLFKSNDGQCASFAVRDAGLTDQQRRRLSRMLDATRAQLLFARGVLLVEGVSEALLLPSIAEHVQGTRLDERGVEVTSVSGVDFDTIAALFDAGRIEVPVAILTDSDGILDEHGDVVRDWAPRVAALSAKYRDNTMVRLFVSERTLEYALGIAGEANPRIMAAAWETLFEGRPRRLNVDTVDALESPTERAELILEAVSNRKADLAQALAQSLATESGKEFSVPKSILEAIEWAGSTT